MLVPSSPPWKSLTCDEWLRNETHRVIISHTTVSSLFSRLRVSCSFGIDAYTQGFQAASTGQDLTDIFLHSTPLVTTAGVIEAYTTILQNDTKKKKSPTPSKWSTMYVRHTKMPPGKNKKTVIPYPCSMNTETKIYICCSFLQQDNMDNVR